MNDSPPAAPCWPAGKAPITAVMFGTWKIPSPTPEAKSATATTSAGVVRVAPLSTRRPPASIARPITLGSRAPQAIGEAAREGRRHRGAERRQHEEGAAHHGIVAALLDQIERREEPDGEDAGIGEERERAGVKDR